MERPRLMAIGIPPRMLELAAEGCSARVGILFHDDCDDGVTPPGRLNQRKTMVDRMIAPA